MRPVKPGAAGTAKKIFCKLPELPPETVITNMTTRSKPKRAPLHPTAARQRKQLVKDNHRAKAETLGTEADHTPKGARRSQLVAQIADLNIEYQAED
jgi:hypothetical protein